ncbi:MAG: hypothetical protein MI702_08530, partial [Chlorobiales bacterium]|nr:hypothetical protein [Chlorobiales bacterium]
MIKQGPDGALETLAEVRTEIGENLYWHAAVTTLAAVTEPKQAVARWLELATAEQVPWSTALVEHGAAIWCHLDKSRLRTLEHDLGNLEDRCALRACLLEQRSDQVAWPEVHAALNVVEPGDDQLHWTIRAVNAAVSCGVTMDHALAELTSHLIQRRYVAPPRDLARFLDLVAAVNPSELQRQLENVLWSPHADEELLRAIVSKAHNRFLQELLLARLESYAAHVAGTDAGGFILRRELLTELTVRLSVRDRDLTWLERAIPRCATSELDGLKSRAAELLARARQHKLATQVVEGNERVAGIESYRVRLLTRLRMGVDEAQLDELLA